LRFIFTGDQNHISATCQRGCPLHPCSRV